MGTGEYSITSRHSFDEICAFHQQILRVKDKDSFPVIIVGHQCHMESDRQVSTQEGKDLAKNLGCKFIEACGERDINVD